MKVHQLLIGVAFCTLVIGCTAKDSPYQRKEYQIASNPASVYCVQQGGELEFLSADNGRITHCKLADGSSVEQWQYYRQNHQQKTEG